MIAIRRYFPLPLMLALATAVYILVAHALAHAGVELVPGLVERPPPVVTAQAATDAGWDVIASYGLLWGGALLVLGLGQTLLKANATTHWLAQGRVLAVATGVLAVLGAIAEWHFGGAPASGVITTLIAAIMMVWHPTVQPASVAKPPTSASGTIGALALALLALALGGSQLACGARPRAAAVVAAFLDCESVDTQHVVADLVPLAAAGLQRLILGSGAVDTAALAADARAVKTDLGRCVLAAAVAALTTSSSAEGLTATARTSGPGLRQAFVGVRTQLGWQPVKLVGGALL